MRGTRNRILLPALLMCVVAGPAHARDDGDVRDCMELYGDFRLRQENSFELDDQPDRSRQRIRFRLGMNFELNPQVSAGARVVTGDPGDPRSPHQTLGNGFDSFDLSLDRAFLAHRPAWASGLRFRGGKFQQGFRPHPVYGELVWDADIKGEGLDVGYSAGELNLVLARCAILEQQADREAVVTAGQASWAGDAGPVTTRLALGWYEYTDTSPGGSLVIVNDGRGNAVVDTDNDGTPDRFASGFRIFNPILSLEIGSGSFPITVSLESIENLKAEGTRDSGWSAGVKAGRGKKPGDWLVYYARQVVEQEAVFAPVAQDDLLFATNHRSHVARLKVQAMKRIHAHLWALVSRRDVTFPGPTTDSDAHQWRVRLDIDATF